MTRPPLAAVAGTELHFRLVHGYRRAYRLVGAGPPIVLVHGIGDSSATWLPVLPALARRHLVIAPDLLGHGSDPAGQLASGQRPTIPVAPDRRFGALPARFGRLCTETTIMHAGEACPGRTSAPSTQP